MIMLIIIDADYERTDFAVFLLYLRDKKGTQEAK